MNRIVVVVLPRRIVARIARGLVWIRYSREVSPIVVSVGINSTGRIGYGDQITCGIVAEFQGTAEVIGDTGKSIRSIVRERLRKTGARRDRL